MPELPEMENYLLLLSPLVIGKEIQKAEIRRDKTINLPAESFSSLVEGELITAIERRGKQLLFHLSNSYTLVLHLMLGGWLYYKDGDKQEEGPTSQVIFSFEAGQKIYFCNLRLGYLHIYPTNNISEVLREMGPDVFSNHFTLEYLTSILKNKKAQLKPIMINQKLMAGVGNAYSDEICYGAKIRPTIKANSLNSAEIRELYDQSRKVLQRAVDYGGYMEEPLHEQDHLTGGYNQHFYVYDREGEQCFRCAGQIVKEIKAGRKIFYCPACQRA